MPIERRHDPGEPDDFRPGSDDGCDAEPGARSRERGAWGLELGVLVGHVILADGSLELGAWSLEDRVQSEEP